MVIKIQITAFKFTSKKKLYMKRLINFIVLALAISTAILGCKKENSEDPYAHAKIEIARNEIVFNTELYNRIGYTIKTWEYEKDGLKLDKIEAIDKSNNKVLFEMKESDFARIYKEPIPPNQFFQWDKLDGYYMSIQVPVPISETVPETIIHRLYFTDTINNESVSFEGGELKPRTDEKPLIINPPVKGNNLCFMMQSSSTYHFHVLFFLDGGIHSGERFAFDEMTFASNWFDYDTIDNAVCSGDPHLNESYFNYGDTLYAVAKGEIVEKVDGRPDRHGDLGDTPLNTIDEFNGNYLILKIAENQYAFYCHVIPGSFMVDKGETVVVGQPLGLLGNSGNSSAPHLHFHICDGLDVWKSNGIPFVFNSYTKIGDVYTGPSAAVELQNAMMEQFSIVNIDF